ncbi:lung seven transmembrane receptor-domain-containing protein [Gigaspora rosea]|uniref:Lung seven transmembrane receptor-domain-containing protein n=1 Tax=Gigaspora rosea TaxID=44941 RepID=A0A397UXL3_9GLOM|nr:lung seven transmembrane receptor-domain-containing protein [Gigaspora rosea]
MNRILFSLFISILITLLLLTEIRANEDTLSNDALYRQRCSGMYYKNDIPGGGSDSIITVNYDKASKTDVAAIVYEWPDNGKVGRSVGPGGTSKVYICDQNAVLANYCPQSQLSGFIVTGNQTASIVTHTFNATKNGQSFTYTINRTGYYCVAALPSPLSDSQFLVTVDWKNPYGELPAMDYPKLPFYGVLTLVYLLIGIIWTVLSIMHRHDLLPVQHYLSGVILFIIMEMAFNWGYWLNYNMYGDSSTFLLCLVAVLNAGRNSISFFMLLIVCMGYGVVKPSLGSTMIKCRILTLAHFVFGVVYAAGTMLIDPETASPLVFLVIFPLALTMTTFYVWTLQSITNTLQTLEIRRQTVKASMYKRLYRLLVFSVSVLAIFFVINMFNYVHREDPDWIPNNWQKTWFLLDGWLNILYLIVFCVILFIWRPTENNKRFAMSEELMQEDDFDTERHSSRLSESPVYEQEKYGSSSGDRGETERLHNDGDDGSVVFDIGDEHDEKSTLRESGEISNASREILSRHSNENETNNYQDVPETN